MYVTNCILPQLFYVLYKHSYIDKMFYNIDILTRKLNLGSPDNAQLVQNYHSEICEVGDLLIAPLSLHKFKSVESCSSVIKNDSKCIWARAEFVKFEGVVNYQKMVSSSCFMDVFY